MYTFEWDFYERREAAAREEELLALETRERDGTWGICIPYLDTTRTWMSICYGTCTYTDLILSTQPQSSRIPSLSNSNQIVSPELKVLASGCLGL
ncbi:hypothetical protein MRB53_034112 [Persea americana]|uniref:Uncharacterized protein n=1 Tax=Persea americana TaxID=3435 RepID=A0ACC2KWX6_PERAE|nr:hypothetical protein MRB53_034112 [Persea americana]